MNDAQSNLVKDFWSSNLDEIEGSFLRGKKITELPIRKSDPRVPSQGSVLLDRVIDIDKVISKPSRFMGKIIHFFRRTI